MGGRIVKVTDALQNILADRPHSRTHSLPAGRQIQRSAGIDFDRKSWTAFLRMPDTDAEALMNHSK